MQQHAGRVRWGVIGLGALMVEHIAPAIVKSSHSMLAGCAGSTPEKARAFAQAFGAGRCYRDIEELVGDPQIEAIFIATPNADHHAMVLAAARAGKHVLCEKPLALSVADGREMVAACRAAGIILRVAFQIRLEEALVRARELIRSGVLGELRSVVFERTAPLRQRGAWRHDPRQGGVLFDVAVHLLDQVRWLTGLEIRELSAYSHPDRRLGVPDDTVAILAALGDDCHAVIRASREIPYAANDLRVQGTRAMLQSTALRWAQDHVLRITDEAGVKEERYAPSLTYEREIAAFAAEVRGGAGVLASGEDGVRAIALASAVIESISTRRSVAPAPGA